MSLVQGARPLCAEMGFLTKEGNHDTIIQDALGTAMLQL